MMSMARPKPVTLREITAENWEEIAELEVSEDQEDLVADNTYSLAESKFTPQAVTRAVYAGQKPVGFIMYEPMIEDDRPHDYLIYRFMIDRRHQGKGYGRKALEQALSEIRSNPDWERIVICYMTNNDAARKFYASLGFKETILDEDGEMIAEINRIENS
jgi:diamine N-acetyltransferase